MDMRTGDLYPSREAALEAGVPADQIGLVKELRKQTEERRSRGVDLRNAAIEKLNPMLVLVSSGPFKGRVYERRRGALKRRKDLEAHK